MLERGREVLAAQPFSALLGAMHGGVISYAADNALTFAGGTTLGPGVVTSEFKIHYLRLAQGTIARIGGARDSGAPPLE